MQPTVIRPSRKPVWCWYVISALAVLGAAWAYSEYGHGKPAWLVAIPAILFVIPIRRHIKTRLLTLTIGADRLTLEKGLVSKYTRTIDLVKVQDVTVRQTMMQRIFGMGDLTLETAGEQGSLSITGIDRPRQVAELIHSGSSRGSSATA